MTVAKKVYIVDDDPQVKDTLFESRPVEGYGIEWFFSAQQFLEQYESSWDGCIVANVHMKDTSGVDFQNAIKRRGIDLPLILMTEMADVRTAVHAIRQGAADFLEKPCPGPELQLAIQRAMAKKRQQRALDRELAEIHSQLAQLTDSESRVLELLVRGHTNKQIASELDIGLRTVELRRSNITKKLEADSLAEVIRKFITYQLGHLFD